MSLNKELTFVRLHQDLQYPPVGMINKTLQIGGVGQIQIEKLEFVGDCLEVTVKKQGTSTTIGTPKSNIDLYAFTTKKEVVQGLKGLAGNAAAKDGLGAGGQALTGTAQVGPTIQGSTLNPNKG